MRFEAAVVVALFALMLRLMIPAGWMPDASSGSMKLVLCSGTTSQSVTIDGHGAGHQQWSQPADHGLCAFSLIGPTAAGPAGTAIVLPFMPLATAHHQHPAMPVRVATSAVRIPPPQGP